MRFSGVVFSLLFLSFAAHAGFARRLHMVYFIDTNAGSVGDDIGPACKNNSEDLKDLFGTMYPGNQASYLNITTVEGADLTPDRMRSTITNLSMDPDDALLVYYCGHGIVVNGTDHVFGLSSGSINRTEIRNLMEQRPARLRILLTDTCTSFPAPAEHAYGANEPERELFTQLFFVARGFVDITAASFGEYAWSTGGPNGRGFFSESLLSQLRQPVAQLDSNGDGVVSWKEFFEQLRVATNERFKVIRDAAPAGSKIKDSASQLPSYWSAGLDPQLFFDQYRRYFWVSQMGSFEIMDHPDRWIERATDGTVLGRLTKIKEDKDFVYLRDAGRGMDVALANWQVYRQLPGQPQFALDTNGNWIQPYGRGRARWEHSGGAFRLSDQGWTEFNTDGGIVAKFRFAGATNGTTFIYDENRNLYVRLTPTEAAWRVGNTGDFNLLAQGRWAE